MRVNIIAAVSKNGFIGKDLDIPWKAKGEQLLFKALTYNQTIIVGRKTIESMGFLPDRKYIVVTSKPSDLNDKFQGRYNGCIAQFVPNPVTAMKFAKEHLGLNQVFVCGGGQIYHQTIHKADAVHRSVIDIEVDGNVEFPPIPAHLKLVYHQDFESNINYRYEVWTK